MRREPSDRTSDVRRETRIWTAHTRIRIHKLILGRTRSVSVAGLCRVREVRPDKSERRSRRRDTPTAKLRSASGVSVWGSAGWPRPPKEEGEAA